MRRQLVLLTDEKEKMDMKIKKIAALAMSSILSITILAGCGSSSNNSDTSGGGTSTESTQGEVAESGLKVNEIEFPLKEKLTFDVFVYASATGGGTYQNNYVTDWLEKKTNIHLNFVYDLDGDDAKTKLNLIMTDPNSMPDIFLATNWSKAEVQSYGEQGLILPLNKYLEDAPNWNASNEVSPERKADLTMNDGKIYTYGNENECYWCNRQDRMYIYKPWIDSLNGGHMPETTDELYEYLQKVKTMDPNGNGVADEIPLTGYIGGWATDPTVYLTNAFLYCRNPLSNTNPTVAAGLIVNDGQIEYQVMKEEYHDALRYMNKLFKEGLMDSQTFTQDDAQYKAILDNEENLVAIHAGGMFFAGQTEYFAREEGRWSDWVPLEPVAGPEGVRYAARGRDNFFGSAVGILSKNCEYPEIAVAMFDLLASEEGTRVQSFGPEGLGWQKVTEGQSLEGTIPPAYESLYIPEDYDWIGNGYKQDYGKNYTWASDASLRSRTQKTYDEQKVNDYVLQYKLTLDARYYEPYLPDIDMIVPNLAFSTEDTQKISEYTTTIGGYVNQAEVQFITGDLDVEKDWDTYIQTLKNMGVEDYIALYQKNYDKYLEVSK